jgi:hypothetical protein
MPLNALGRGILNLHPDCNFVQDFSDNMTAPKALQTQHKRSPEFASGPVQPKAPRYPGSSIILVLHMRLKPSALLGGVHNTPHRTATSAALYVNNSN